MFVPKDTLIISCFSDLPAVAFSKIFLNLREE